MCTLSKIYFLCTIRKKNKNDVICGFHVLRPRDQGLSSSNKSIYFFLYPFENLKSGFTDHVPWSRSTFLYLVSIFTTDTYCPIKSNWKHLNVAYLIERQFFIELIVFLLTSSPVHKSIWLGSWGRGSVFQTIYQKCLTTCVVLEIENDKKCQLILEQ